MTVLSLKRRIKAAQHLADNTSNAGEREAALAAVERLRANSPTRAAVKAKGLMEHQRRAWMCLVDGAGHLTKWENSFLHSVRAARSASGKQMKCLADIERRIAWEATL
jgi:hypothetical protein